MIQRTFRAMLVLVCQSVTARAAPQSREIVTSSAALDQSPRVLFYPGGVRSPRRRRRTTGRPPTLVRPLFMRFVKP